MLSQSRRGAERAKRLLKIEDLRTTCDRLAQSQPQKNIISITLAPYKYYDITIHYSIICSNIIRTAYKTLIARNYFYIYAERA